MAFYLLHNILFPVTKLANQHLLLDEFYRIEWTRASKQLHSSNYSSIEARLSQSPSNNASQEQAEFISTHTILFAMSLINFAFSHRCLNGIHHSWRNQRRYLFNLLLTLLVSLLGYLYTANTIASLRNTNQQLSGALHWIHGAILIIFLAVSQWAQFVIGSICDTLSVRASISQEASSKQHPPNSFVTQLMIGSFSAAFMSLSLTEIFINNRSIIESRIGYTNIVLVMAILSILLELVCFRLLTVGQQHRKHSEASRRIVTMIDLNGDHEGSVVAGNEGASGDRFKCMAYTLSDDRKSLPPIIWSISARNARKNSETTHSTDDDEFGDSSPPNQHNNSEFQLASDAKFRQVNKQQQQQQRIVQLDIGGDVELFDRTKYSLYEEDFEHQAEEAQESPRRASEQPQRKTIDFACQKLDHQCGQLKQEQENLPNQHGHFSSVLEVLLIGDWPFVWQTLALIVIGIMYQANQFCYFSEYINYLLYKSPWQFKLALLVGVNPLPTKSVLEADTGFGAIWICLVCVSILMQNLARVLALQYANNLLLRLGTNRLIWLLLIVSLTIPIQFLCNHHLVETSNGWLSLRTRTIMVLSHIIFIQLVVGFLGALADWIINELALQYCQHVRTYRTTKILSPDQSDGSIQCTIHGLLNGSFLYIGTAIMSALRILADNASCQSLTEKDNDDDDDSAASLVIVFIAFVPMVVMLMLSAFVGFHKWSLVRSLKLN